MSWTDPDAFCYYCQVQLVDPEELHEHLRREHHGTHAYHHLVPEARATEEEP